MIFSNEKNIYWKLSLNIRNHYWITKSTEEDYGLFKNKDKSHKTFLSVLRSDGKSMSLYFFKSDEKIRADVYYRILRYTVLLWLKKHTQTAIICNRKVDVLFTLSVRPRSSIRTKLLTSDQKNFVS